jgi:glyoxylase-like metal-dependent hydrolase (beta-lactamase superfamily II)
VEVARIAPGLWRWTGWHAEWNDEVGCVYCETTDGVVLIDPLVPPEDAERFWRALDRDVERIGGGVHVLVSVFWHTRDAAALVERYGARVWAPARGRAAVARRAGVVTDPFRPGDRLPGGIAAQGTARAAEVVYWLPAHRALVPGDVLLGAEDGGVRLCPESWLPEKTTRRALAESLWPLLELPLERILVSHGEPVLTGARDALVAALAAA